jgi:hypothetical protein
MLTYDAQGHVSVVMMRCGRSKFASGDDTDATHEEIKEAFEGFEAYYGTYEVDIEQGTVTHHIEGCRFPNWEGTDQMRFFELSGDQLHLRTTPYMGYGKEWVWCLVWERVA